MKEYLKFGQLSSSQHRNDLVETSDTRSRKTERRTFKIPEKVKMEFKSLKTQPSITQQQDNTHQRTLHLDDQIQDGIVQRMNTSIIHRQQIQQSNINNNALQHQQSLSVLSGLKSPFQMRISREEGEKLSDHIIQSLEAEIKVIFTPELPSSLITRASTSKDVQENSSNTPLNSQMLATSQLFSSQNSQNPISQMSKSLYVSRQSGEQPLSLTNRQFERESYNSQLSKEEEKNKHKILKQHQFLVECRSFRFLTKRGGRIDLMNQIDEAQDTSEEDKQKFMRVLTNRLKLGLFFMSTFRQRIGQIQHQSLYFYNQEQMNDYFHKLLGAAKFDEEMNSIFKGFLSFLWHFSSVSAGSQAVSSCDVSLAPSPASRTSIPGYILQPSQETQISFMQRSTAIFEHFKMFLYGIKLPLPRIEYYPAHKAAFEGNLPLLRRILLKQQQQSSQQNSDSQSQTTGEVSSVDCLGLSPLQLAVQMESREAVIVCCENESDPHLKSIPGVLSALEMAIAKQNEQLLKPIFLALQKRKHQIWENITKKEVQKALQSSPDFSCRMRWEQESSFLFSFLKRWTPSDTYKIFKRGQSVRIDMGMAGADFVGTEDGSAENIQRLSGNISNKVTPNSNTNAAHQKLLETQKKRGTQTPTNSQQGTWSKGAWSLLLKESGSLLLIDHKKLSVTNAMTDISISRVENKLDELLAQKRETLSWQIKRLDLVAAKN